MLSTETIMDLQMLPPVDYPDNVDFHVIFNGPFVRSAAVVAEATPVPTRRRGKKRPSALKQSESEPESEIEDSD